MRPTCSRNGYFQGVSPLIQEDAGDASVPTGFVVFLILFTVKKETSDALDKLDIWNNRINNGRAITSPIYPLIPITPVSPSGMEQ